MPSVIQADIRDSLGTPLVGYIQIDLDYDLDNLTTSFLSVPAKIPLVNGQANFSLEPSESARVSYSFTIYRTVANQPDEIVREKFHATVPDSATPIKFTDLVPTGITQAALDGSLSAISRRLVADDVFWSRFQDELLQLRGNYDPNAWYQRGNMVLFQGGTYVYISRLASTGNPPTAGIVNTYWMPTALPGQTVLGAIDANAVAAKADKTYVDSRDNLLAPLLNALLTGARSADSLPLSQNDNRIVSANWVQSLVTPVRNRTAPIGSLIAFAGSSAPAGWAFCDGRVLSRATFSELFAIVGTQFNVGGEAGTDFRLPDLRGRMPMGVDSFATGAQGAANRVPSATHATNGGSRTKILTVPNLPSHSHTGANGSNFITQKAGLGTASIALQAGNDIASLTSTDPVGSGTAFEIMPPYLAINYCIHHGVI